MPFMQRDDFRLYYEDSDPANTSGKPVVLFLHGAGGNHVSWFQQVPAFAPDYRCITVDQRGFGQSPDTQNLGPAALAADALALLDHLGVQRAAVVTQSMGGWGAVGAVIKEPQRFWAVVLGNTVGNLTDEALHALRKSLLSSRPSADVALAQAAIGATFRKKEPVKSFLYAQLEGLNPARGEDFGNRLYGVRTPVAEYAARGVPTLFITGDEDLLIRPELSEAVHRKLPGSRFVCVAGAGHSTYFEQPERFNADVSRFLAEFRPA